MISEEGFVLRAPRSAGSNARTTDEAVSGVERDFKPLSPSYQLPAPTLVDIAAEQYRASVLSGSDGVEYLIWAANTATLRGSVQLLTDASLLIPTGSRTVQQELPVDPNNPFAGFSETSLSDGTLRAFLSVPSGDIGLIETVTFRRGDTGAIVPVLDFSFEDGWFTILGQPSIDLLGGGLSKSRGDSLAIFKGRLSGPTFWWTKNDSEKNRFFWESRLNRWVPKYGSRVKTLGKLGDDLKLSPRPEVSTGSSLPGDPAFPAKYSMLRVGTRPDETSRPLKVMASEDLSLLGSSLDAIMKSDGSLVFSSEILSAHTGVDVWFNGEEYFESREPVGVFGSDLTISPVPYSTERPFIRIAGRAPLEPVLVPDETTLAYATVDEGQVGVSLSTGRLKFSSIDLAKADPSSSTFDIAFFGSNVYHDGCSLTQRPVPLKSPTALVGGNGFGTTIAAKNDLFLREAEPTPGQGVSGVLFVPDKTGRIPSFVASPGVRPGPSGLVRSLGDLGDLVLFTESGQIQTLIPVEDEDSVPKYIFKIPKGTAYVDLRDSGQGSRVILGREDRKRFHGESMYFLQSHVTPSVWCPEARVLSQKTSFVLKGDEVFTFRVNETVVTWDASLNPGGIPTADGGTFTPEQILQSLNAVVAGTAAVGLERDRVLLESTLSSNGKRWGEIEIGFGSGNSALGFLPGWLIKIGNPANSTDIRRLPDSGMSLGVFRNPLNLDGRKNVPDIRNLDRYEDELVTESIPPNPVFLLNRSPLESYPGYDVNTYFQAQIGLETRYLKNYENMVPDYPAGRVIWAEEIHDNGVIQFPVVELPLSSRPAFDRSFDLPGNGLRISRAGEPYETLDFEEDYLIQNGSSVLLVERVGTVKLSGSLGSLSGDVFSDPTSDFSSILAGDLLGFVDSKQVVRITEILSTTSLRVDPSPTGSSSVWEIYNGVDFESGVLADVQSGPFNHLPEDPFRIRLLSDIGTMPLGDGDQQANRRSAILGDALNSERAFGVRVGEPSSSPFLTGIPLTVTDLGVVAPSGLSVETGTERFDQGAFEILVGSQTIPWTKVVEFSDPIPDGVVEIRLSDGALGFSSSTASENEGLIVSIKELFLTPASSPVSLPQGKYEYDPLTGLLNFSVFDMAEYGGTGCFFVEEMNPTAGDVSLNPIQGSFSFSSALRSGQRVEADYFLAQNGSGDLLLQPNSQGVEAPVRIIEFLSLPVSLETATKKSELVWEFNPTGRTLDSSFDPYIYSGSDLCNVGSSPSASIQGNTIVFKQTPKEPVRITYAVYETFGGEQSFSTSRRPVYRPPFRIEAGTDRFILEGQRNLPTGSLLIVGTNPLYVVSTTYDPSLDETTVVFQPETVSEIGSRNPASEFDATISDRPLSQSTLPKFWAPIQGSFEPFNRGATSIIYHGDLTSKALAGHLLEIGGVPFLVNGSRLVDGGRTEIFLASASTRGFNPETDASWISVRPVYETGTTSFEGLGPLVPGQSFQLISFDATGLGRVLTPEVDYAIDVSTGNVDRKEPLESGETLYLRQTRSEILGPEVVEGRQINPRYIADYVVASRPSEQNGLLRVPLRATYTFEAPDTWFVQILPLAEYLGIVAQDVAANAQSVFPSTGSPAAGIPGILDRNQGRLGLRGQIEDLEDQDRASRAFIEFFDKTIQGWEQIQEALSGDVIGDRDGKFKFFIGRGKDIAPPGYEDPITGRLNRRNVFGELWFAANRSITLLESDPVVDPWSADLDGVDVVGKYLDPDALGDFRSDQKGLIKNEIDDVVLVSRTRSKLRLFPLRLEAFGNYRLMGEPSSLSRLFPERMTSFSILDPGIGSDLDSGDPGVYAFTKYEGKLSLNGQGLTVPQRASTFQKPIGSISNPVYGAIENLSSIEARERLPRAVVFAYSPTGFPEMDPLILQAGGVPFSISPRPAVMATPLTLKSFPLDSAGNPDVLQLAAGGGDVPDLTTGDPDLLTPPFRAAKVAFGRPNGTIVEVTTGEKGTFQFPPGTDQSFFESVFVDEVLLGCILTFSNPNGTSLTTPLQELSPDSQETLGDFTPQQGFTIFVVPDEVDVFAGGNANDPVTQEQREAQIKGLPEFRVGFDVKVDRQTGQWVDISLPSFFDPSPLGLKETLGQRPPKPMMTIEADVSFVNARTSALEIPALLGQSLNDSGDRSIPYVRQDTSEIVILGQVQSKFGTLLTTNFNGKATSPDEIQGTDGSVSNGVLSTARDFLPGDGPGKSDTRPFDFFFVEPGNLSMPNGAQGMLSVGKATQNTISPPRFVAPTKLGDRVRYLFSNVIAWVNQQGTSGMVVRRVGNITTFDTLSISTFFVVFNDGTPAIVSGGLNNIFDPGGPLAYPNNGNIVRITLWDPNGPTFLQTVEIQVNDGAPRVLGDLGFQPMLSIPQATDTQVLVDTAAPFASIGLGAPPVLPEDPNIPGQSIPLWFSVEIDTMSLTSGSFTAFVDQDRVTFRESVSMKTVPLRGSPLVDGLTVEGELSIQTVTGSTTEDLTVNSPLEVNGGLPFTFLSSGSFQSGNGSISVPGFDGFGAAEIQASNVVFSALASTNEDIDGVICSGLGTCESSLSAVDLDNRIALPSVSVGKVLPGDVVVVTTDDVGQATTKAGTYLVKHAVDPDVGPDYKALTFSTSTNPVNTGVGVFVPKFPEVVSLDMETVTLVLSEVLLQDGTHAWAPTGRVYFISEDLDLAKTKSLEYIAVNGTTFTVLQGSGLDSLGAFLPDSAFSDLAGSLASGFVFFDVDFEAAGQVRNLVGFQGDGSFDFASGGTAFGFRGIEISNIGSVSWTYETIGLSGPGNLVVGSPGLDQLGMTPHVPIPNTTFVNDPRAVVYPNVAMRVSLEAVSLLQWQTIHVYNAVSCLFPGDILDVSDFRAQGGIFLEPSVPRPVQNYFGPNVMVVDADHGLNPNQIGFRDGPSFGSPLAAERVAFEVRRIRRFHDELTTIGELLKPLRYVYETRRGVVTFYGPKPIQGVAWDFVLEADGTNLGSFIDERVNVNSNDILRILDTNGTLLGEAEIAAVVNETTLMLKAPGLSIDPTDKDFEIWLKQPMVPHEQSHEQLVGQMLSVIKSRVADFTAQTGGYVPVKDLPDDPRALFDTDETFSDVNVGDYLIIDPAGNLAGPSGVPSTGLERGSRPFGDRSVMARDTAVGSQEVPFQAGKPSQLDDNRGFYRIVEVASDHVVVDPNHQFGSGISEDPVVFGTGVKYAVLPTVSNSNAPFALPPGGPGIEGQNDLRPTAFAGEAGSPTNSFLGNMFSIAPLSYRILRANPLFSTEAIETLLFSRERTLSWMEEFDVFFQGKKYGSYFVFQRDLHIEDLGDPLIPDTGLGVMSNELIDGVRGLVDISPFANTSDCLSILDRRFWVLDSRLDREYPPGQINVPAYSALETSENVPGAEEGDGRPVLPDLISDVLDNNDKLRQRRFFWIQCRVDRERGTLQRIKVAEKEYRKRRDDFVRQLVISESLES